MLQANHFIVALTLGLSIIATGFWLDQHWFKGQGKLTQLAQVIATLCAFISQDSLRQLSLSGHAIQLDYLAYLDGILLVLGMDYCYQQLAVIPRWLQAQTLFLMLVAAGWLGAMQILPQASGCLLLALVVLLNGSRPWSPLLLKLLSFAISLIMLTTTLTSFHLQLAVWLLLASLIIWDPVFTAVYRLIKPNAPLVMQHLVACSSPQKLVWASLLFNSFASLPLACYAFYHPELDVSLVIAMGLGCGILWFTVKK